jgi:hypothetical protein
MYTFSVKLSIAASDGQNTVKRAYNNNIGFTNNVLATVKTLNAEKDGENYLLFSNDVDSIAYLVKQDELKHVII